MPHNSSQALDFAAHQLAWEQMPPGRPHCSLEGLASMQLAARALLVAQASAASPLTPCLWLPDLKGLMHCSAAALLQLLAELMTLTHCCAEALLQRLAEQALPLAVLLPLADRAAQVLPQLTVKAWHSEVEWAWLQLHVQDGGQQLHFAPACGAETRVVLHG